MSRLLHLQLNLGDIDALIDCCNMERSRIFLVGGQREAYHECDQDHP